MGFGGGRREPCHFLASTRSYAEGTLTRRDMWFGPEKAATLTVPLVSERCQIEPD